MEKEFGALLKEKNIDSATISVLSSEKITSLKIFQSLREAHFSSLLPKVKIGDHAVLLSWWESCNLPQDLSSFNSSFSALGSPPSNALHPPPKPGVFSVSSPASPSVSSYHSDRSRSRSPLVSPVTVKQVQYGNREQADHHKDKKLISSGKSIEDLVRIYKSNAVGRFKKGSSSKTHTQVSDSTALNILLGGMIFDEKRGKGIRRKSLPEPNPTKIEMPKNSTIFEVFEKAIQLYYKGYPNISVSDVMLADSSGDPIVIDDMEGWELGIYYSANDFIPSRHKLYTMIELPSKAKGNEDKVTEAENLETGGNYTLTQTYSSPIINQCCECGRDFRTYTPGIPCEVPDGGIVLYDEPQILCPLCDDNQFGSFMNYDLFPELRKPVCDTALSD